MKSKTAPKSSAGGNSCLDVNTPTLIIILRELQKRGIYSVSLDAKILIKKTRQPESDLARVLHKLGYGDETLLIMRRDGSEIDGIRAPLGVLRKLKVREDGRSAPRFVKYEPFPSKIKKRQTVESCEVREVRHDESLSPLSASSVLANSKS
jgi:hypothetical protein